MNTIIEKTEKLLNQAETSGEKVYLSAFLDGAKAQKEEDNLILENIANRLRTKITDAELELCPFCNGEAEYIKGNVFLSTIWFVKCRECYAKSDYYFVNHPSLNADGKPNEETRYTEEQAKANAAAAWNRRVFK